MNLVIQDKPREGGITGKEYHITYNQLKSNATHLFIASNEWDELHITLCEEIPLNVLKYVRMACKDIKVLLPVKQTEHIMELMCELYPDKTGKIRKYYMMKKDMKLAVMEDG